MRYVDQDHTTVDFGSSVEQRFSNFFSAKAHFESIKKEVTKGTPLGKCFNRLGVRVRA